MNLNLNRACVRAVLKTEGVGGFFKGFTPKLLVVGPKLVFSMAIAQSLMRFLADKV
jgi:hypothetical protein